MQNALARSTDRRPFPLPRDVTAELARSVTRAAAAMVLNKIRSPNEGLGEKILTETWPSDRHALGIISRSATAPATTATAGWAAELAITTTAGAFLASLPASAASKLFAAGLMLPLEGTATVKVPYAAATPSLAPSFVTEGSPIPLRQAALSTVTLAPKKLAVLTSLTNEVAEHSTPVAEVIIRQILNETATRQLDAVVFTTAAGGLLNGVTPITATAGGGVNAALGDLKALTAAITTAGGTRVMLFLAPAMLPALAVYAPTLGTAVKIVPTPSLGTTLVAIDPDGVVSGASSQPRIDVGKETNLHFEDTTPLQLTTGAQGSAVAATPVRSMFQTDSFSLRLLLECAWAARPGYVQFIANATW